MGFVRHSILFDAHVTQKPKAMILVVLFVLSFYSTYGISNLQSQSTSLLETPIAQSSHVDLDDIVLTSNVPMTSIQIEMDDGIHSGFQLGLHFKHSCMVNYDSSLYCWGNNDGGRIGVGNNTNSIQTPDHVLWQDGTEGASATMVAVGDEHSCAVLDGATKDLVCWGRNGQAQLGVGNASNSGDWRYTPNNVSVPWGSTSVEALALGNDFSCGLLGNGSVYCWGWNGQGTLGDGKSSLPNAKEPQFVDLNTSVTAIESGLDHICALSINGSVICWGRNDQGQGNGDDTNGDLDEPSVILLPNASTGDKWIDLSLGDEHTCALSENNSVYCWGRNDMGQLGLGYKNNTGVTIWPPEQVLEVWNSPNSTYPRSLQGGHKHNCVLLSDDSVYCWGRNSAGELGQGNDTNGDWTATPQNVSFPGGPRIESIQAGGRHSCAMSSTNTVYCWGQNDDGQLGLGNTTLFEELPIALSIPSTRNWSIHPALPSGLTLNNTTGELSGTPQSTLSKTAFTVFANASSSQTRIINITINEQPPNISYNSSVYVLTLNQQTHLPITPNSTGGPVVSWAIEPTLPSGLSFGTNNGTIYGTPTQLWNSTAYMVWANNSGGSANATLTILVIDQPAILSYNPENMTLTKGMVMTPNVPTITGGVPETLAVDPPLPSGLLFGTSNGTIYGTPDVLQPTPSTHTVWANNSGGNRSVQVNITILDQLPNVSYPIDPLNCIINTSHPDLPLAPINTGGEVISWQITPPLPTGLELNATTGAIDGIPSQLLQLKQFTITATNSGGSFVLSLNISVVDVVPNISYNPNNITMTINRAHNAFDLYPTISGSGTIASWELSGPLPNGVEFNETTGAFSGIPSELFDETTYTIWGNNSGGSANTTFTLKVVDEVPAISYPNQALVLTNNTESPELPLEPVVTGNGSILGWDIRPPTLPEGLSFGATNGTVWGIPTELWPEQTYTVTATNTGGEISTTLSITVLDKVPLIWYNHTLLELVIHQESTALPLFAQDDGTGDITSWDISPPLPDGLEFGGNNGTIWGVPSELLARTTFILTGSNSGGSSSTSIDITVVDQLPSMSYEANAIVLTRHQASPDLLPLEPQIIGNGTLLSWTVLPALPDGLEFGGNNGTIWGIPTQLLPQTRFTIFASNSGGEVSTTLFITVVDVPVNFSYNPIHLNMTIHMQHPALPLYPLTVGPGVALTWEIEPQLPAGLTFSTTNGSLSGVPRVLQIAPVTYTVWANNSGGPANASVTITINPLMEIEYPVLDLVLVQGQRMAPMPPSSTPGVSGQWTVLPDLPVGLMIGPNNGTVSGVPQYDQERIQYTIQFSTVDYGQALTLLFITVLPDLDQDGKPDSGYDQANFTFDDDDDGDGWNNTIEVECGSDPQNSSSVPKFSGGVCILKSEEDRGWPYIDDLCLPPFIAFLVLMALLLLYRNILLGLVWFTLSLIGLRKVPPPILIMEDE
ncbi:MAG: putative Ig domain-containing protein [Poseidonia sp.]